MKKKALSDTIIKIVAGTLPSGRVLLKGKKKPVGIGGEGIFKRSWLTTDPASPLATSQN